MGGSHRLPHRWRTRPKGDSYSTSLIVRPRKYPPWVPAKAVEEAVRMLGATRSRNKKALDAEKTVIQRLLTDQRMQAAWRELGNQKRSPARTTARGFWPSGAVPEGLSDQDIALTVFFFDACRYAQHVVNVLTIRTWKEKHQTRLKWVTQLRQVACLLELQFFAEPEAEEHLTAIHAAAAHFEKREMQGFHEPPLSLIGRNQGDPLQRRYAVLMAEVVRKLFGKSHYTTIATVTNVALVPSGKVEATKVNVRDWCAAALRVRARISKR
jgi:hypothetical protein